ncbi:protein ORFE9A [Equid gammaherpesvirus 5]|nr:protein ORFE9A [Equid gammaherpesvirus 5]
MLKLCNIPMGISHISPLRQLWNKVGVGILGTMRLSKVFGMVSVARVLGMCSCIVLSLNNSTTTLQPPVTSPPTTPEPVQNSSLSNASLSNTPLSNVSHD